MKYYLVSVSNRTNLNLCINYAMAGFTNSINGAWTYVEIDRGDFLSFLYGAKVYNLYRVKEKIAIRNADKAPPWPPVTFSMSGRTYYFPFRLILEPLRKLEEPLVRAEFSYVAENLLLRGGYRKTHFQADQTTLQSVSQMGIPYNERTKRFDYSRYELFDLKFTRNRALAQAPEIFHFNELILQSAMKNYLSKGDNLEIFLSSFDIKIPFNSLEILGEKALPEGHVDLLIKDATPIGSSNSIIVEVKSSSARTADVEQTISYGKEMGDDCLKCILVAKKFPRRILEYSCDHPLDLATYKIGVDLEKEVGFSEITNNLQLSAISKTPIR